jgi:hypothetical protein
VNQSPVKNAKFAIIFFLTVLVLMAAIAGRVIYIDAYWIFRNHPVWLDSTKTGRNNVIDIQMRNAKILHLLTYNINSVIIGSSVAYRGINPINDKTYNSGISSFMSNEIEQIVKISVNIKKIEKFYIGLDYYMFTDLQVPVKIEFRGNYLDFKINSILNSVFSFEKIQKNSLEYIRSTSEDGGWMANGFRQSQERPSDYTLANNDIQRRSVKPFAPKRSAHLEAALSRLGEKTVVIYLSPVSRAQIRNVYDTGHAEDFRIWRQTMSMIAHKYGAQFYDLVDLDTEDDFLPENGSSRRWLDTLHFKPIVGDRVLEIITKPR